MSQQGPPPGQEDDEIQGLAILVAENLQKGESPQEIAQQLVENGWEEDDAVGFVGSIQRQLESHQQSGRGGGGGMGWLIWIGAILLINALSYLFNWGFWIY
jgi:hypothetical protein